MENIKDKIHSLLSNSQTERDFNEGMEGLGILDYHCYFNEFENKKFCRYYINGDECSCVIYNSIMNIE